MVSVTASLQGLAPGCSQRFERCPEEAAGKVASKREGMSWQCACTRVWYEGMGLPPGPQSAESPAADAWQLLQQQAWLGSV